MSECVFCKIMKGEIPCCKIYEDDKILAFLDIAPVNKGHMLVVPKKHFETLEDTDSETFKEIMLVAKKIAPVITKAVNAQGFNLGFNNKKAAGQLVPHLHIHIIPRFENDDLTIDKQPTKKYAEKEMRETAEKIRNLLKK